MNKDELHRELLQNVYPCPPHSPFIEVIQVYKSPLNWSIICWEERHRGDCPCITCVDARDWLTSHNWDTRYPQVDPTYYDSDEEYLEESVRKRMKSE